MQEVAQVKQGTDVVLYIMDANDDVPENIALLETLKSKSATILVINKIDKAKPSKIANVKEAFTKLNYVKKLLKYLLCKN